MTGGNISKYAHMAAEHAVQYGGCMPVPSVIPTELMRQAACYVTVYENPGRHIRAMWGSPLPRKASLAQEIISNTTEAIRKQQTGALRKIDLPCLSYSIAVLGTLERVTSKQHLNPQTHGLYLTSDTGKKAVILSQRIGVTTVDEQLATATREACIDWQNETVTMYRFSTEHYD